MATTESHVNNLVVSTELKSLMREYPALRVDEKRGKVCCCLTGHQMPMRVDAVRSFVQGKKFQKAQADREYDFEQHRPHLVTNTKRHFQHTLFCTLTLRCVTKRPEDVERHVNGKRYQRALKRWQKCQETGEKFKPKGGRRRGDTIGPGKDSATDWEGAKGIWQSGSENEDDDSDDDDLNDLYPSDDFASASDDEEDDDDNANTEDKRKAAAAAAEQEEVTPDPDSDTEDTVTQSSVNGQPSHQALKRKKLQKPGGKKFKKK
ncbi:hypothetical protein ACOMHN_012471 [Nucella lapillus]